MEYKWVLSYSQGFPVIESGVMAVPGISPCLPPAPKQLIWGGSGSSGGPGSGFPFKDGKCVGFPRQCSILPDHVGFQLGNVGEHLVAPALIRMSWGALPGWCWEGQESGVQVLFFTSS